MTWFYAFLAFAALVVLHELGHFAAAKSVGMRVEKFSLFFPPAIGKIQKGETSYQIGAIPLGGYVKITGMNPEEEVPPEHLDRAYFKMPVWKRIVVIGAGPAMNIAIAFVLIFVLFAFIGQTKSTTIVKTVSPDSPAAGQLAPGDKLVSFNGQTGTAEALVAQLAKSKCTGKQVDGCAAAKPVKVVYSRDGAEKSFVATPHFDKSVDRMRIGLTFDSATQTYSLAESFSKTVTGMWNVTKATIALPAKIFNSQERKQIHGTAGSYKVTQQAFSSGAEQTIGIIALISLSLA